jgi:hypothetical protein
MLLCLQNNNTVVLSDVDDVLVPILASLTYLVWKMICSIVSSSVVCVGGRGRRGSARVGRYRALSPLQPGQGARHHGQSQVASKCSW